MSDRHGVIVDMTDIRRRVVVGGALAGASGVVTGCSGSDSRAGQKSERSKHSSSSSKRPTGKKLGDGSMADTGPQPKQPKWHKLKPGEKPPQFVVISWDGGGETGLKLNSHFQKVARECNASMTIFVSGIYFVPDSKRTLYHPPGREPGESAIGFFPPRMVRDTIEQTGKAWLAGHEIGTHFNGHFCGPKGVDSWSSGQWKDEIKQAKQFVSTWRTHTGFSDLPPLPFDYDKELVGGRTPCLEGTDNLRKAAADLGWRYDSSGSRYATWPEKVDGLWDLSMQSIPFPGTDSGIVAMDYNFLVQQSDGEVDGDKSQRPTWRRQTVDSFMAGFRQSYEGNRAPMVIGNHFENWNGGIYMEAVEDVMRQMAKKPDTHLVSFRQLCEWLDRQDPAVLRKLQKLGSAPQHGWDVYLA